MGTLHVPLLKRAVGAHARLLLVSSCGGWAIHQALGRTPGPTTLLRRLGEC
jgi:hypothetical protein